MLYCFLICRAGGGALDNAQTGVDSAVQTAKDRLNEAKSNFGDILGTNKVLNISLYCTVTDDFCLRTYCG